MKRFLLAGAVSIIAASPALSQTALETAGFIVFGDEAILTPAGDAMRLDKEVNRKDGVVFKMHSVMRRIDDCRFTVDYVGSSTDSTIGEASGLAKFDFSKLRSFKELGKLPTQTYVGLQGDVGLYCVVRSRTQKPGEQAIEEQSKCDPYTPLLVHAPRERWDKALNYMQSTICKGRAF